MQRRRWPLLRECVSIVLSSTYATSITGPLSAWRLLHGRCTICTQQLHHIKYAMATVSQRVECGPLPSPSQSLQHHDAAVRLFL